MNPDPSDLHPREVSTSAVLDPAALAFLAPVAFQPVTRSTATAQSREKTFAENKQKTKRKGQAQGGAGEHSHDRERMAATHSSSSSRDMHAATQRAIAAPPRTAAVAAAAPATRIASHRPHRLLLRRRFGKRPAR